MYFRTLSILWAIKWQVAYAGKERYLIKNPTISADDTLITTMGGTGPWSIETLTITATSPRTYMQVHME